MATKKPNYPLLAEIGDPKIKQLFRILLEKHAKLEDMISTASIGATPLLTALNGGNQRVTKINDPKADQDAVNKRTLIATINAKLAELGLLKVPPAPVRRAPFVEAPPDGGGGSGGPPGGGGGGSHVFTDANGNFLGFGASLFWLLWGFLNDRDRLAQNLQFLADGGVQYVRAFGTVGGSSWADRLIDPNQAGYQAAVAACTDWTFDNFGLRVQWTILGTSDFVPSSPARAALVTFFGNMAVGREHKIFLFEIANEAYNNGLAVGELRQLTQNLNAQTSVLVAPSAPEGGGCWDCAYGVNAIYAFLGANVGVIHFDRGGNLWRPVQQPYGADTNPSIPGLIANNEPIGPQSSGQQDDDPLRLSMAAAVGYITGVGSYVYHSSAGIRGEDHVPNFPAVPATANWFEHPNVPATFTAMRNVRGFLPSDVANWDVQNTNPNFPNRPWDFVPGPPNDASLLGYLWRMYSTQRGNDFYSIPFGLTRDIQLQARRNMSSVQVYNVLDGTIMQDTSVNSGDFLNLPSNPAAVIIKGIYA